MLESTQAFLVLGSVKQMKGYLLVQASESQMEQRLSAEISTPGATAMNTLLVNFYSGAGTDLKGRTFQQILDWDDDQWEKSHDHIQWTFPLPEKSAFNPLAPILDDDTIEIFKTDPTISRNITASVHRFETFLGMHDQTVETDERPSWWRPRNHNLLRITRYLRFLTLVNRRHDAAVMGSWLESLDVEYDDGPTSETFEFWRRALTV